MRGTPLQRLEMRLRHALPIVITLFLILIVSTPMRLPGFASIAPQLPLIAVYYWAIFRPDLLRPWVAFLLGAVADIISGTPLGVSSLVFLAIQAVADSQRRVLGRSFLMAMWGFILIAAGAMAVEWIMSSLVLVTVLPIKALIFQYLMTLTFYPLLAWVFVRAQVALLRRA
ncbi:MAG TPA: rod shape-determining protein MreD [Magnetospirillaceae bacterium]|jgi:rod shape-determining protein MreD